MRDPVVVRPNRPPRATRSPFWNSPRGVMAIAIVIELTPVEELLRPARPLPPHDEMVIEDLSEEGAAFLAAVES